MIVKMMNPRGRVVEVDDHEVNLVELSRRGFIAVQQSSESNKVYNPVFDKGPGLVAEQLQRAKGDTRQKIKTRLGDNLELKRI